MNPADVETPDRTAAHTERLSLDLAFEAIADERRRTLVGELLDAPGEVDFDELVVKLAGPDAEERQIEVSLYHTHLPKLEAMGIIAWDDERNCVESTPLLEDVEPLLRTV